MPEQQKKEFVNRVSVAMTREFNIVGVRKIVKKDGTTMYLCQSLENLEKGDTFLQNIFTDTPLKKGVQTLKVLASVHSFSLDKK